MDKKLVIVLVCFATLLMLSAWLPSGDPHNARTVEATPSAEMTQTAPSPTALPTVVDPEIAVLDARVQGLESAMQVQTAAYSAAVSRMEMNINILLGIIAVASLLAAIVGFGVVRNWIRLQVEEGLQKALTKELDEKVDKAISGMRADWESRIASLYDEYKRALTKK